MKPIIANLTIQRKEIREGSPIEINMTFHSNLEPTEKNIDDLMSLVAHEFKKTFEKEELIEKTRVF